jgi:hypothetical protein
VRAAIAPALDRDDAPAPRGAIPNWQPATTFDDYIRNCREGLEEYSDRRLARITGWSRMHVFRMHLIAELPKALFERLLAADDIPISAKALAGIALALRRGQTRADIERCPHCGEALRVRYPVGKAARKVITAWLNEDRP